MSLTKDQKKMQVQELRDYLKRAKSLMFMNFGGLSVTHTHDLRGRMLEKQAELKVAKKTLFRIAAKEEGYPDVPDEVLQGPVAFVFSFSDELSGAKVAFNFGKDHEQVKLIGGVFDGKVLSQAEAIEVAKMMGKEELLTKFALMLRAPLSNFASLCGGPLCGFARALKEISEKKGKESIAGAQSTS